MMLYLLSLSLGVIILSTGFFFSSLIMQLYKINVKEKDNQFEIAGFAYDEKNDLFYSTIDAWQREYGYCHFYDVIATPISLVVDCEPVIFEYNNKLWLIELWKGQYGMTTGAEIGIYNISIKRSFIKNVKAILFNSASDDEMLDMSYALYKDNQLYFTRSDKHWWLTGFKLGDFANPKDLKMNITILFKDKNMRNAFIKRLLKLDYDKDKINVYDNQVNFIFDKPHTKKPWTRTKILDDIAQSRNAFFVDCYREIVGHKTRFVDNINLLKQRNLRLYNRIIKIGLPKKIYAPVTYFKKSKRKAGD